MPAKLARIRFNEAGLPVSEYLHRDEALFAEAEWTWRGDKDEAHVFATTESAEQAKSLQREQPANAGASIFVLICDRSEAQAARQRREDDRIAAALAGREPQAERGVAPQAAAQGAHAGRRQAAKQNRRVAAARKQQREAAADAAVASVPRHGGAQAWKEVFERMEARHPHEEVFDETERRVGS